MIEIRENSADNPYNPEGTQEVELNQRFNLFDKSFTIRLPDSKGTFQRDIFLCLPNGPKILWRATNLTYYGNKSDTITPFDPHEGYQITKEDFDSEARQTKMIDLAHIRIGPKAASSKIWVQCFGYQDKDGSVTTTMPSVHEIMKQHQDQLKNLRLFLSFPSRIRAVGMPARPESGVLHFGEFSPLDLPPPAAPSEHKSYSVPYVMHGDQRIYMPQAFKFAIPNDPDKLASISAQFQISQASDEYDNFEDIGLE
jgi:hypothetical protein